MVIMSPDKPCPRNYHSLSEHNQSFSLCTMQATRHYVYDVNILIATYGLVLGTNYLVGFILLVVIYTKLLRYIKKLRAEFGT
jgi:hypothetical protein